MRITPDNILAHELIGLNVFVKDCSDPTLSSLRGSVVDETRNTLKLKVDGKIKMVSKGVATFIFTLPDGLEVGLEGWRLVGRPEERVARLRWRR